MTTQPRTNSPSDSPKKELVTELDDIRAAERIDNKRFKNTPHEEVKLPKIDIKQVV